MLYIENTQSLLSMNNRHLPYHCIKETSKRTHGIIDEHKHTQNTALYLRVWIHSHPKQSTLPVTRHQHMHSQAKHFQQIIKGNSSNLTQTDKIPTHGHLYSETVVEVVGRRHRPAHRFCWSLSRFVLMVLAAWFTGEAGDVCVNPVTPPTKGNTAHDSTAQHSTPCFNVPVAFCPR